MEREYQDPSLSVPTPNTIAFSVCMVPVPFLQSGTWITLLVAWMLLWVYRKRQSTHLFVKLWTVNNLIHSDVETLVKPPTSLKRCGRDETGRRICESTWS